MGVFTRNRPKNALRETLRAKAFALRCSRPLPRMFAPCSLPRPCGRPCGQRRSPCAALALCPNVRPVLVATTLRGKAVSLGQKRKRLRRLAACNPFACLAPHFSRLRRHKSGVRFAHSLFFLRLCYHNIRVYYFPSTGLHSFAPLP